MAQDETTHPPRVVDVHRAILNPPRGAFERCPACHGEATCRVVAIRWENADGPMLVPECGLDPDEYPSSKVFDPDQGGEGAWVAYTPRGERVPPAIDTCRARIHPCRGCGALITLDAARCRRCQPDATEDGDGFAPFTEDRVAIKNALLVQLDGEDALALNGSVKVHDAAKDYLPLQRAFRDRIDMVVNDENTYEDVDGFTGTSLVEGLHDGGAWSLHHDRYGLILEGRGRAIVNIPPSLRTTYAFSSGT